MLPIVLFLLFSFSMNVGVSWSQSRSADLCQGVEEALVSSDIDSEEWAALVDVIMEKGCDDSFGNASDDILATLPPDIVSDPLHQ